MIDLRTPRTCLPFRVADDRLQFVTMRDPRAAAVSTFFHEQVHPARREGKGILGSDINTLDEFVLEVVPVLCEWVALRYFLFSVILESQSTLFWYQDAIRDAHRWHYEWIASVGLHLPEPVVEAMADAAVRNDFDFETKGRNEHPGGSPTTKEGSSHRPTWRDMLRPESLVALDVIVRKWLPPMVIVKLNL